MIVYVMAAFAAIGAVDKIIGNRLGLGTKFEEGISTIAGLSLAMVGILSLAPVLGNALAPLVVPVFEFLGADAAMFAGCFFAIDGGAPAMASALSDSAIAVDFSGIIVGGMMGVTVIFTIPVSMEMTEKEDRAYVAIGVLAGLITIPIGCFVGGLVAGYPIGSVLKNLIPIILLSLLIALGVWKFQALFVKGFIWFGKIMMAIILFGLGAGILESLTGMIVIPGMNPISEGFAVVAEIAIVLAGAYPFMHMVTKILRKPLMKLAEFIGVNEISVASLLVSTVNSFPMFAAVKNMNVRGKVINIAFAVSASFALGDHLGFTAGYKQEMIFPMICGKLVGGVTAVIVALLLMNKKET